MKADVPPGRLNDARIVQVEVLDGAMVVVAFSNGDSVAIETDKLKTLVLSKGSLYVSAAEAKSGPELT